MPVDRGTQSSPEIQDHLGSPGRAPIRVMLVEDHPLVLFGIHALLDAQPDIHVVGREAVDQLRSPGPTSS